MAPIPTLQRPSVTRAAEVGNDGLTNSERSALARKYRFGAGSRRISPSERAAIESARAKRASSA